METYSGRIERLSHFLHKNLLWLLLGSYAVAAAWPGPGLKARSVSVGEVALFHEQVNLSLPVLMLATLLLNAGLGVQVDQLRGLARRPAALLSGLAANVLIPIAYILSVSLLMGAWHNPDEVQNILVGLALVASMPIAGSSTAWSQNVDGDLALSLGLVLGSTLLSPLTTPLALHAVGFMARGDYAEDLHELAAGGAGAFLALGVILPSLLGIALRLAAGERRVAGAKPALKLVNTGVLLFLNYSNAAASLPQTIARPDPDFLAATLAIVIGLCALMFAAGWALAWWVRAGREHRVSLMFGLGMNNNGTGLVMASLALADHPRVLLPIIFYNLVQHLVAGAADRIIERGRVDGSDCEPGVSPECLPDHGFGIPRAAMVKAARRAADNRGEPLVDHEMDEEPAYRQLENDGCPIHGGPWWISTGSPAAWERPLRPRKADETSSRGSGMDRLGRSIVT